MTETEDILAASQDQLLEVSQNLTPVIDDQEYMRSVHGRSVSDVIDDLNKGSTYYFNQWCEITLLPSLIIADQLFLPIETCARLIGLKQAIEQDEQGEEARRNYIPSSVLTEAELYLRLETIWWLDKSTGAVSVDAERVKMKESNDQLRGVESLDFEFEDIPDGVYVHDSEGTDDINNEEDAPKKKSKEKGKCVRVRKCELYKTVNGRKYNSKQVGLCWYYE